MTPSEYSAESLVCVYLNGRTMPKILRDAVVWVVASRLTNGETPVLDETLRSDIDHQAVALAFVPADLEKPHMFIAR